MICHKHKPTAVYVDIGGFLYPKHKGQCVFFQLGIVPFTGRQGS